MRHPDEIWVVSPRGFRPSAWVEMLVDYDECYDLDPHLIDRRQGEHGEVLVISTALLDTSHPLAESYRELLLEMMDKVATMGLILRPPPGVRERFPVSWGEVELFCASRKVTLEWMA